MPHGRTRSSSNSRKQADSVEQALQALNELAADGDRARLNAAIAQALDHASFRIVARAASLAGDHGLEERVPDLLAAFARLLPDGAKQDPLCQAKAAITTALLRLDCQKVDFWLDGIRVVQQEPSWGRFVDTAVDVRCNSAMGLVKSGHRRATVELTALLTDKEPRVRAGAARAISCGDPAQAEPLLRLKIATGDAEAEVLGECFTALLAIAPDESMQLVGAQLSAADEAVRDYAALALGESRHPLALDELKAAWKRQPASSPLRGVLARAAALHRSEPAFDWLIGLIERGRPEDADLAEDALSVYERNGKLMQRVKAARAQRQD